MRYTQRKKIERKRTKFRDQSGIVAASVLGASLVLFLLFSWNVHILHKLGYTVIL